MFADQVQVQRSSSLLSQGGQIIGDYTTTWLLCEFSLVVSCDLLLKDTHTNGVKSTPYHSTSSRVVHFFILYTLWRHLWSITVHTHTEKCYLFVKYMFWGLFGLKKHTCLVSVQKPPGFLTDEGPMLETLDFTIHIGSTPTLLYFDLYLYSAYAAHQVHL